MISSNHMKLNTTLQKFGLKPKEAAIYLAALELGSGSVQNIAAKAGVIRSTAYEILEVLREKGLVTTYLKKHIRWFSAEDPDQIWEWAQRKVDILKEAIPELTKLAGSARRRPSVRFYEGKEEMNIVFNEILTEADTLIGLGSSDDLFREMKDTHKFFLKQRIAKKIPLRIILRDTLFARERQRQGPKELREVKLISEKYSYHGQLYVWKNKIAQFSFRDDFVAVVTESRELADMQRALFENLWALLPR